MSTARLTLKLGKAEYELDCLGELEKAKLLEALAGTMLALSRVRNRSGPGGA